MKEYNNKRLIKRGEWRTIEQIKCIRKKAEDSEIKRQEERRVPELKRLKIEEENF